MSKMLLALPLLLSASFAAHGEDAKPAAATPPKPSVSLEDIRAFTSVFNLVKQAYVEPVDDKVLMQAAIRGLPDLAARRYSHPSSWRQTVEAYEQLFADLDGKQLQQ